MYIFILPVVIKFIRNWIARSTLAIYLMLCLVMALVSVYMLEGEEAMNSFGRFLFWFDREGNLDTEGVIAYLLAGTMVFSLFIDLILFALSKLIGKEIRISAKLKAIVGICLITLLSLVSIAAWIFIRQEFISILIFGVFWILGVITLLAYIGLSSLLYAISGPIIERVSK
jgi:hypothetical protein